MSNSSNSSNNNNTTTDDPPPPPYNHRTTTAILRHTTTTTLSLLPTTLFLTLLLFSFRSLLDSGTLLLTSFIDRDPSFHSLLSRLSPSSSTSPPPPLPHRRRRPFLHLTRVGTLDDDFFSSDADDLRSLFGPPLSPSPNSSYASLTRAAPGNFIFLVDHLDRNPVNKTIELNRDHGDNGGGPGGGVGEKEEGEFRIVIGGLELGRRDLGALYFLMIVLSAAYGWVILGFVITYSWALGVVFVSVVNELLGRYGTCLGYVWGGCNLGVKRLSGFILMRWAVRDALTQVLGLWFFGEVRDQFSFFKLFLRLKLMPFSVSSPWVAGYDKEVGGFLFAWFLVDTVVSFVFAVDSWVTIVNTRRGGREIVKEGCYLLATMIHQSIQLKCLELILCGAFMRWVLALVFGRTVAVLLQSLIEVYFMVAWLIFYFAARCKDASLSGRRFGRRELEGLVEGLR